MGLWSWFFPRLAVERSARIASYRRQGELQDIQHATAIAEAHAQKTRAESAALALMEVAQAIPVGDIDATRKLMLPTPEINAQMRQTVQNMRSQPYRQWPIPRTQGADYYEDLREIYRQGMEIEDAAATLGQPLKPADDGQACNTPTP